MNTFKYIIWSQRITDFSIFIIKISEIIKSLFICTFVSLIVGVIHIITDCGNNCLLKIFCDDIYFGVFSLFLTDIILAAISLKFRNLNKKEKRLCIFSITGFLFGIGYYIWISLLFCDYRCDYMQLALLMIIWWLSSIYYIFFKTAIKTAGDS